MIKVLAAAAMLLVSLSLQAIAGDVMLDQQPSGGIWVGVPQGDDHGIWIVNTTTGHAYHCSLPGGTPQALCLEAVIVSAADAAKLIKEIQPKK